MQKQCEHCGRNFSCDQAVGCWCGTVKLDQSQLAWVKQNFHDCLCPGCLAAVGTGVLTFSREGSQENSSWAKGDADREETTT